MASSSPATAPAPFDPNTQNITVLDITQTPFNISVADIDSYVAYGTRISINYSSQIGASAVLLIVLLLVTTPEKRTSAIFFLNALALTLNTIRNVLQCLYFTGPFYKFYPYFSGDYSAVPTSAGEISITGDVLTLLLLIALEASLVLQVRVVCVTMTTLIKTGLLILSTLVALAAIGIRFGLSVTNAKAIAAVQDFSSFQWLAATNNYVTTASICFFSAVFVAKLGLTINQRRRMDVRQFGPMQVIFIMGCQTLIVPAVFSILENFTSVPELGSQVLTVTALFLPLSSMWASASLARPPTTAAEGQKKRGKRALFASPHLNLGRFLAAPTRGSGEGGAGSGKKLLSGLFGGSETSKTYEADVEKKGQLSLWSAEKSRDGGVLGGFDFKEGGMVGGLHGERKSAGGASEKTVVNDMGAEEKKYEAGGGSSIKPAEIEEGKDDEDALDGLMKEHLGRGA